MADAIMGDHLYREAELYDIAFSYRDYEAEAGALIQWATSARGGLAPASALELAAGPADHALALRARGLRAAALDLAPTMCEYAAQKASARALDIEIICANMLDFRLQDPVDLAFLMVNSVAHLHTLEALTQHLKSVADNLNPQGIYVIETQHPKDFVGRSARATGVSQPWTVRKGELQVTTRWGRATDSYDPIKQLFSASVLIEVEAEGELRQRLEDTVIMRDWTLDELRAAALLSARFDIADLRGSFDGAQAFDNSDESWRLCLILRRR